MAAAVVVCDAGSIGSCPGISVNLSTYDPTMFIHVLDIVHFLDIVIFLSLTRLHNIRTIM